MEIGQKAAHDDVVGAEHRDSRSEKDESRDDRQQAAYHPQDQQGNTDSRSHDVGHVVGAKSMPRPFLRSE